MHRARYRSAIAKWLRFPLVALVLGIIALTPFQFLASRLGGKRTPWPDTVFQPIAVLAVTALAIVAYKLFQRWIEQRADSDFPVLRAGRWVALGLLIGFLLFSSICAIVWSLGGLTVEGWGGFGGLWTMLAMALLASFFEELLFRALLLRQFEALIGTWGALFVTSALFGLFHAINPYATWYTCLAIAIEAGIPLGAAYVLSRNLWFPVAIHFAWNFTEGWVLTIPVSRLDAGTGLVQTSRHGPEWLSGGIFGLEASVVPVAVSLSVGLVMLVLAARRGQIRTPIWTKNRAVTIDG